MPAQTVNTNVLVLLIDDDPASIAPIREALSRRTDWSRLQCVGSVPTGLARIAGGGVNVVLLNLSLSGSEGDEGLSHFHKLHAAAPGVPIVVLCREEQESLALNAVRAGAADYMIKERCAADLGRLLQSVLERRDRPLDSSRTEMPLARRPGTMIAVLGAKGGVGATTVALNVGAALARRNQAIVAELRPTLGTLLQFFRPQARSQNVTCFLDMEPAAIAEAQAAACLWHYRTIPGLSLLFGPPSVEHCRELGQTHAQAILAMLARLADFIVVDLPPVLSETNRAVIQASDVLALVIDRDSICMQAGKMMLQAMEAWKDAPDVGAVIVNRAPVNASAPIAEIELQLGIPIFGVIPPAPDLCTAAQNARTPVVAFDAESLAAGSMTSLAERLANPGRIG